MHDAEDDGRRADAERKGRDDGRRIRRALAQHPTGVADFPQQPVREARPRASRHSSFTRVSPPSERSAASRAFSGLDRRGGAPVNFVIDVELQLGVELLINDASRCRSDRTRRRSARRIRILISGFYTTIAPRAQQPLRNVVRPPSQGFGEPRRSSPDQQASETGTPSDFATAGSESDSGPQEYEDRSGSRDARSPDPEDAGASAAAWRRLRGADSPGHQRNVCRSGRIPLSRPASSGAGGWIAGEWSATVQNRRIKSYMLTASGRRKLSAEKRQWARIVAAVAQVLEAM